MSSPAPPAGSSNSNGHSMPLLSSSFCPSLIRRRLVAARRSNQHPDSQSPPRARPPGGRWPGQPPPLSRFLRRRFRIRNPARRCSDRPAPSSVPSIRSGDAPPTTTRGSSHAACNVRVRICGPALSNRRIAQRAPLLASELNTRVFYLLVDLEESFPDSHMFCIIFRAAKEAQGERPISCWFCQEFLSGCCLEQLQQGFYLVD